MCVEFEDRPLHVGKMVCVTIGSGRGERAWTGTVVDVLQQPSALDLALPEKRAASAKEVRMYISIIHVRMYIIAYAPLCCCMLVRSYRVYVHV